MHIPDHLIELSEMIGFGFVLSDGDNRDGLRCWRNGIYIIRLTSSPLQCRSMVALVAPPLSAEVNQLHVSPFTHPRNEHWLLSVIPNIN